jgi:predicted acyltransferase
MGVLQRIAICYLVVSLLFLYLKPRTIAFVTAGLLLAYWAMMMLIPVPGFGAGLIDQPDSNLSAWVDQLLIPEPHIYREGPYDPEGILSTIPAIATTLLGVFAGMILMSDRSTIEKTARLMLWGFMLAIIGYIWDWFFPINKSIWSSSYAIFTGGLAMQCFGACYWLIDVKEKDRFTRPFVVYGVNALIVFFVSGLLGRTLGMIKINTVEGSISLQRLIFNNVFMPLGSELNASLLYAITWIVLWYFVLSYMYKRKIIIKV